MKTILCPIELSVHTDKFVHYIGDFAKDTHSKVCLISLQTAEKRQVTFAGSTRRDIAEELDEFHDYLSGSKQVPCGIEESIVKKGEFKKLGLIADRYDLMAMTIIQSGHDDRETNVRDLTKMLHETLVPILLIPAQFPYKKVNRLLYAYDYKHEPEPPLLQLLSLSDWFESELKFVSVLPSDISTQERDRLTAKHRQIENSWKGKKKISFERIIYPDVPRCLDQYLSLREMNDLLILSINHRNMLEKIWHKSVVSGLINHSEHPYLIIHK